jgi:AraC-like DNA-binding protein
VQPVATVEAFLSAPVGRYFVADRYLVWCKSSRLAGSCHWDRLGHADILELTRFLTWRATEVGLDVGFDMISDVGRVAGIDTDAYQLVTERFPEVLPNLEPMVRHFAFVHGGGFLGAVMAGVVPMAWNGARFCAFEDAREAFGWLENRDAFDEVAMLIERATGVSPTLDELRRYLRAQKGATSLEDSARALGRSPRSLQRHLREVGRGFRDELNQVRIESARQLLLDSDLKLEAIAEQVGLESASQFTRLFRQLAGELPSEFRARHRPR